MLIKQQLMEGVQTYVGDFLVTATDGGEYLQGKEALLLHCLRVVHSLVHLIPLVHLLVPLAHVRVALVHLLVPFVIL